MFRLVGIGNEIGRDVPSLAPFFSCLNCVARSARSKIYPTHLINLRATTYVKEERTCSLRSASARGHAFAFASESAIWKSRIGVERPHVWMILGRVFVSGRRAWTEWKTSARRRRACAGLRGTKIPPQAGRRQTVGCLIWMLFHIRTRPRNLRVFEPSSNQNDAPLDLRDFSPSVHLNRNSHTIQSPLIA